MNPPPYILHPRLSNFTPLVAAAGMCRVLSRPRRPPVVPALRVVTRPRLQAASIVVAADARAPVVAQHGRIHSGSNRNTCAHAGSGGSDDSPCPIPPDAESALLSDPQPPRVIRE